FVRSYANPVNPDAYPLFSASNVVENLMTKNPLHLFTILALTAGLHLSTGYVQSAQVTLFSDNFSRVDNIDISAATNGMRGSLLTKATLSVGNVWIEPVDAAREDTTDAQVLTNTLKLGGNGRTVHAVPNRNFANDFAAGTFSVTMRLATGPAG